MSETKRIDIVQEFVDLHRREQMLGFFEFRLLPEGRDAVSGLCRISQPKAGKSQFCYLSLTFLADTDTPAVQAAVDDALGRLEDPELRALLPEALEVVPTPMLGSEAEAYVRQVDLLLDDGTEVDRRFLSVRLLPAVRLCTGIETGEMEWWEAREAEPPPGESLTDRVRQRIRGDRH